jgi:glutaredoxin
MELASLNYVNYKLGKDFDKKSFYGQFGEGSTFPQVVLNGTNLGGCTETVQYLKEKSLV